MTASKRIVVVDDEPHIRLLLAQILAPPDFEVYAFEDPRDALMKLHDLAPDLIVCDVLNAARAQELYFTAQGGYFTGACTELPGFVPSPGVFCATTAGGSGFAVTTSHPYATYATCVWTTPAAGGENPSCS